MADYNVRGNAVANTIYDKILKPEDKEDFSIPEKPAGIDELPPNINMSAPTIKNLSELKQKTPKEQFDHDNQMKNPTSAYTRKEKKELENLVEAAKDAGVLKDDADLASQTPAGEASIGDPLNDYVNPAETETKPETDVNVDNSASASNAEDTVKDKPAAESPNETKAKQEAKAEGKYKLRSIMDAYNEGLLDKDSRDYLIVDALGKFARNTGKDLSNLAAAYTGGSQNNDRESGIWEERNKTMAEKGIGAEGNQFRANDNYDIGYKSQEAALESQQLANTKERIKMIPAKNFTAAADRIRETNPTAAGFMDLIAAASTQGVDPEEYIAMAYATDPNAKKLVDEVLKTAGTVAGGLGAAVETVNNFLSPGDKPTNDVADFFKGTK